MAVFPDRFIKGSRFTEHFTLDDPSDQVVPKPGTDTAKGILALNLGNNLPGDTTNATDALTAAGFNAMANQPDTTAPFCGNAIQQAVTVAVGQSIGCDAAAQEAIACAIASNPEAVACLAAALPSGCDDSGTILLDAAVPGGLTAIEWKDGVATQLTSPLFPGVGGGSISEQRNTRYQNPGNLTNVLSGDPGAKLISLDTTSLVYASAIHPQALHAGSQPYLNHEGTRLAFRADFFDPAEMFIRVYDVGTDGRSLTLRRSVPGTGEPDIWLGENLLGMQGGPLNIDTGAVGTVAYNGFNLNKAGGLAASALSKDYTMAANVTFATVDGSVRVRLWTVARSGDNVVFTQTTDQVFYLLPLRVAETVVVNRSVSFSWTPDNSQLIVSVSGDDVIQHVPVVFNVIGGGVTIETGGMSVWGEMQALNRPLLSADGKFVIMLSGGGAGVGGGTGTGAGTKGTAIFKKNGAKWRQIGFVPNTASTIVGGVAGYSYA
jgi:hypothetical protein